MATADIRFDNEGRDGMIAVGTYLADAARRLGIDAVPRCIVGEEHGCKVRVTEGQNLLSPLTKIETDILSTKQQQQGYRLACQAKIETNGVLGIMTEKKKETTNGKADETVDRDEQYRKEFAELPLEKKIANLVQLEVLALGETFAFVINSPFKIAEKLGDVMAEFGFNKEQQEKRQTRPEEHQEAKRTGSAKGKGKATKSEPPKTG